MGDGLQRQLLCLEFLLMPQRLWARFYGRSYWQIGILLGTLCAKTLAFLLFERPFV